MAKIWTNEQQAAIDAKGKLTVLSAAAGSGKTTVLVEKALRLLFDKEEKTDAASLLIVTFSNASAKEFKNRIEKGLNDKIKSLVEQDGETLEYKQYLNLQKMALQKADISTISTFCIKLVRENFEALDISPDFTICDEARAIVLHDKAIDKAMKYGYTLPAFCNFVSLFGKSSQDKQVREFLKEMYQYFSALPFPKQKAQDLARLLDNQAFKDTEIYKAILQSTEEKLNYAQYLVARENEIYDLNYFQGYQDAIIQDVGFLKKLQEEFDKGDITKLALLAQEELVTIGRANPKCEYSEAIQNVRKKIKDTLGDILENVKYLDEDRYRRQQKQTGPYIHGITDAFSFYIDELLRLKKEQKTFEFADFEQFAVEILMTSSGVRTQTAMDLQEKYVKIMEDEFQDTSYVQDMIFTAIAKEKESNLFVVGDAKQSIYGFRKASPEILLEKRQRGIIDPSGSTTIVLPHNFRSEKQVIDGINYIFERIMTAQVGGVEYKDGEQLKTLSGKGASASIGVQLEIYPQDEPAFVAKKIDTMIKEGYEIVDGDKMRPVISDDFCILLRNSKKSKKFAEELAGRGISAYIKDNELILNKPEVQSVISILRVINNPLQEVYLTAGMFGDLFEFSLDEILKIRLKTKKGNLYKALVLSDQEKAVCFLNTLKDFSSMARVYSADKLINYIIKKTGYYTRLALSENGEEKRENLRWFMSFAKRYASAYQSTLNDFIRWIDLYIESGKGASSDFQRPKNSVAIMTMHTSKGLEFPVCFVSGLGTKFNKQDQTKRLLIDTKLGMATFAGDRFGYNSSTAGVKAVKEKALQALADDEMRLLYVALTRAKNLLVLTAQYGGTTFTANTFQALQERTGRYVHPYAVKKANCPIDWVLMGYLDLKEICQSDLIKQNDISQDFLSFEIVEQEIEKIEETQEKAIYIPEKTETQQMAKELMWQYSHKAKTKLPIKLSVGEIAKAPPPIILQKPFFAKEQKVTAAQKGTAMHRFAQYSDILLARANLANEILRLENLNLIDPSMINVKQIEKFIFSEIASRILNGEKVYAEKEFLVPYSAEKALDNEEYAKEAVIMQGVIDCIVIKENTALVIDYKTDKAADMAQLYERYVKQLELYRYATGYLFEITDIKCIIYSFYLGEYLEF